jgi:hypothetical protein
MTRTSNVTEEEEVIVALRKTRKRKSKKQWKAEGEHGVSKNGKKRLTK